MGGSLIHGTNKIKCVIFGHIGDLFVNNLKISVVVCTYNRAKYLSKCIDSLLRQSLSPALYEILIVDNNSSDSTAEICRQYEGRGNFRYYLERNQGLSYARNRGFRESRSTIVAYTDDDAIVSPGWLSHLVDGFNDNEVGATGGPIFPIYEGKIPGWFHESLLPLFSCKVHGKEVKDLNPGHFFYGVNMAIRKDILIKTGGFRVDLGRKGNNLLSDEELALFKKIERAGYKKRYLPEAVVYHLLPKDRLNIHWLLRKFYWMGINRGIREKETMNSKHQRLRAVYRAFLKTKEELIRPIYWAGLSTRLIPIMLFSGYTSILILGNKNDIGCSQ